MLKCEDLVTYTENWFSSLAIPSSISTMAPTTYDADASSRPLADYFFIAGLETSQIYDERSGNNSSPQVAATIEEGKAWGTGLTHNQSPTKPASPRAEDQKRRSRYSFEARKSISSTIALPEISSPMSNRSSATIRPVAAVGGSGLNDEDFEHALRKFANERDSFLEEIHVAAGAVTNTQPTKAVDPTRHRPRTVRIKNAEEPPPSGLRSGVGSLRRRLSTMNGLKRQSSNSRQSTRTSKRISGYQSVIPAPQPFRSSPDMHPLKRRYEPAMLDRYPSKIMREECQRRCAFPDYVPMFAFPNDVSVVSSDDRPRSTWHGFAMTTGDASKLYGICVTLWIPLNAQASEELERQCEAWRKANISDEERELASSLGERLATERAKLSRLLAQLPNVVSGSTEREDLADEISATEEKIGLMADLLRPVRHGAASKIDGLTDGDTGFWIPRVYGVLGRDINNSSFWKEWLKAIVVPMTNGAILRVPASSPKVGIWQPLERYVVNMLVEAPSPMSSLTQIEVGVRELRLFARREAVNELPGSRNTDLYALFRALPISEIVTLFEYVLSESRIILLSSHASMLHLASAAISSLLWPMQWTGVFIPVLPSRLLQAIEAPCPYIVGVEKRFENIDFPDDDFVLVDLDQGIIESTAAPMSLPRQQRRKLTALLQAAAPHHNRFGVPVGPPQYAVETFPNDAFSSENSQIFRPSAEPATLASHVNMSSAAFADNAPRASRAPIYNAFSQARATTSGNDDRKPSFRPSTSSNSRRSNSSRHSPPSDSTSSPLSTSFPTTPTSRSDSVFGITAALREKRSGQFDSATRRNSTVSTSYIPFQSIRLLSLTTF